MALKSLSKLAEERSNSGGSGGKTPAENVAVQVVEYHIQERGKSNVAKDYIDAVLLHDALGKKQGEQVRLRMRPHSNESRRDIAGLARKMGTQKKVNAGGVVVFERCWIDRKTGDITANWAKPQVHDAESSAEYVLPGMIGTVFQANNDRTRQRGLLIDTNASQQVSSMESFRELATNILAQPGAGSPSFIVRATMANEDPSEQSRFAAMVTLRRYQDEASGDWVDETPEEALARMDKLAEEGKHPTWAAMMEDLQTYQLDEDEGAEVVWEIMPANELRVGGASLPQSGKRQDGREYSFDMADPFSFQGQQRKYSLYTPMIVGLKRNEDYGFWSMTYAQPTVNQFDAQYFNLKDIPSPLLPKPHLDHVMENARTRSSGQDKAPEADAGHEATDPEAEAEARPQP